MEHNHPHGNMHAHQHHQESATQPGGNFVVEKAHAGHDKHEGHSIAMFKDKFWLSLALSAAVVLYSGILKKLFGFSAPAFPGSDLLPLLLGSVVFFYGGWVFVKGAYRELKDRQPGMMTLIAMAISVAYLYSLYAVLFSRGEALFWELATLITIMLLGHWMEMKAVLGAQGALKELSKLLPDTAEVVKGNKTEIITLDKLQVGDVVVAKPGGKIAADGTVIEGSSEVNESMATGESLPVVKQPGDQAIAGTVNGNGSLRIRVDKIGESTFLAGIMKMVAQAQSSKSKLQMLSDRAAYYLTIIALISASLTFVAWMLNQAGANFAFERTVAVLVIACPHALGLAIPLVASISTDLAAKNGLLVKQRLALEAARDIDMVVFDKTGTLTHGEPDVTDIIPFEDKDQKEILMIAASLEKGSEHSLAETIVKMAEMKKLTLAGVESFLAIPGHGVEGGINGKRVSLGNRRLMLRDRINISRIEPQIQELESQGKTVMILAVNSRAAGLIAAADTVKDSAKEAIAGLKDMGIEPIMITGDNQRTAKGVADQLGIKNFIAEVLPQDKANEIKKLQASGKKAAMVGDGINDAPALAQADLGIAIGAGTNVAIESAGIILVKNDPRDVLKIIKLSRLTYAKMIQNLFWATGYNVVALPLAAGVLASRGITLEPALAAVFMSLSTIIVALNAAMLKRNKLALTR